MVRIYSLEKDASHIYLYFSTGLHKKDNGKVEGEMRFSIVTKEGVVYQEYKSSILNTILMIWRYGLISLYKLNNYVGNMLDNFARYSFQNAIYFSISRVFKYK